MEQRNAMREAVMARDIQEMRDTTTLLGVVIDRAPLAELVEEAMQAVQGEHGQVVFACANPHSLVVAQRDFPFFAALNRCSRVVADGVGITLVGRWARVALGPRVTGSDYFQAVMAALQAAGGGRVFFLGSTPEVLARIAQRLARDYPAVTLAGTCAPPFGVWSGETDEYILEQIRDARPDVLWVGMTAPRQEKWVDRQRQRLPVPVIGCIGAVFDFYAGTRPRAPAWACRAGLEWAWRLAREPRRLWRRNLISSPLFLAMVLRQHILAPHDYRADWEGGPGHG